MRETAHKAIAIVGVGAVLPDAPDVPTFWSNLRNGRYSITETPADRWSIDSYWDPDPRAPDKTYSKIGGWVRDWRWDPIGWKLPIPPRVGDSMDRTQKWAILAAREALSDYGWPTRSFDAGRTAVILGNAMAGERHYMTALRLSFPEYARELQAAPSFAGLPAELRETIEREIHAGFNHHMPEITEDTMPGELANIIAGRIANLFDFHGPNYVVDAACASAMAAIGAAIEGLEEEDYDVVLTGGVDANMSAHTFIKFCKIGALSATGTRPYADGADGFVMGEGSALFVLKRLTDAERDGDKVYAVIRGVGGSSDGRGKGITAPNPAGQKLAVERAWENAGLSPGTAGLLEGHGTSTRVGDVAEVESLNSVFGGHGLPTGSIPLGSVKSNIGHLKGAAGAAGILKTALALHDKVLPPSLSCGRLNPNIDFAHLPFRVNTELRSWDAPAGTVRRAGASAFGFGGTNFHVVLEEHVPGMLTRENGRKTVAVSRTNGKGHGAVAAARPAAGPSAVRAAAEPRVPPRGIFLAGASRPEQLAEKVRAARDAARAGQAPPPAPPQKADLHAPQRIAIDYGDAAELAVKTEKVLQALPGSHPGMWRALRSQGIFYQRSTGAPPKVAFLYTGQGSQYLGMLANLRQSEPVINETFAEADRVMTPILGRPLTSFLYLDETDPEAVRRAEEELRQTAITQPAVLTVDIALTRVLAEHGIAPDLVMGHSLGEYGALVAAGSLSFAEALEAVAARGREMTRVSVADKGRMIAVMAPLDEIEQVLASLDGYAVVANINSTAQAVVGGASDAVTRAEEIFRKAGREVRPLPVSHAFHTSIVAPASEPLQQMLARLDLRPPEIPIVANATGRLYPMGPGVVPEMIDLLGRQIAAPVQFVQGLRTLYEEGARIFVEVGPKRALHGFAEDVLGKLDDVLALATNHPKVGDVVSLNHALCGLYAAGCGNGADLKSDGSVRSVGSIGSNQPAAPPVVVTGGAVGLPGPWKVFDDANLGRLLHGEQAIDVVSLRFRRAMVDKHITRLVKSDEGGARFETIESAAEVIKLAARAGELDLARDFGIPQERLDAWDHTTRLAVGAGLEALRDAGIPLVLRYKTATTGARLPDRWGLPDELRDDTGVIFASAFPGYDSLVEIMEGHQRDKARRDRVAELKSLRARCVPGDALAVEIDRRIRETESELAHDPYVFDRRFLFRVLSMGHSQFAELIGARGPNTQINAACASTTQAFSLAQDWIRAGRCRRVVVVAADDITTDRLMGWFGAGFLASGAAATDELVEDAALPFDRRRHGLIIGMGAAAVVIESPEAARERGLRPICELLSAETANSAFHGSRLDVRHIGDVMEKLVAAAEARWGIDRHEIAPQTVFVSHETYTPARGGSAQAEVDALRQVFGPSANRIVVANTKGYTGHPMAVGIEDVMAVKSLETGLVPPVPNLREPDPDLGGLNLSEGGAYPVQYALRLGAGFGSQIGMTLLRWVPTPDGVRRTPDALGYTYRIADPAVWRGWLARVSGDPQAEIEVVHRTLRVVDRPALGRPSAPVAAERPLPTPLVTEAREPAAAPQTSPAPPAEAKANAVQERVLGLIAEKTGYPREMLALDLDLEADLGIDTVKQAEMFAAIRQEYGIPRDENLKLRDFPTLAHTIQFVFDRRPDLASAAPGGVAAQPPEPPGRTEPPPPGLPLLQPTPSQGEETPARFRDQPDEIQEKVLALIAEKTGYPVEMLDLDLDLEADLGIDTVKQAEMFAAIRQEYGIPRDENLKLRDFPTLAHTIQFVYDRRPDLKPAPGVARDPAAEAPDAVQEKVLALIAEKTGYPVEMLDLDLDLEADLGIDTVKQAEMFAAIRQEYGIPRDENLKLRDFPTLAHTIGFVYDRRPDLKPSAVAVAPSPEGCRAGQSDPTDRTDRTDPSNLRPAPPPAPSLAIPRRLPTPVLRPALDLCKPTGVTLGPGSRVVVAFDQGGVGKALAGRLAKRGVEVLAIEDAPDAEALAALLQTWHGEGPVQGIYWLTALDREPETGSLDLAGWREALRRRVKLFSHALRALESDLNRPGSFVIAATRLGGWHGYDAAGAVAPLGGAVTGLAKAIQREWPETLVKAVDFPVSRQTAALAEILADETLRDPGAVEIGWEIRKETSRRWTIGLTEEAFPAGPGLTLGPDTVFVVTGAAGSIVSAILQDLTAAARGGVFHLLDLAPAPDPADPDLARFVHDREGLKRDLFERIKARGERATPALVEKELARLERGRAALDALLAIQAAGGRAVWHRLDLRDGGAVRQALDQVRRDHGRVDVLLHAGGLEISRRLADKTPEEYDLVFDVKADGWFNLLSSLGDLPLGAAVVFSSIAGRFGNAGQTDYSAANDLLCKQVSAFRQTRPGTLGIALDWTAWGGIGMATRGSIPQVMEAAGIDMLSPETGVPWVRRELAAGTRGEVVVAGRLGVMLQERDATGGLDVSEETLARLRADGRGGLLVGQVRGMGVWSGLEIETTLDPAEQPFLDDHRIDGTPVLPGVMGVEAFAEAASFLVPDLRVAGVEDVEFLAPFKFYRNAPRTLTIRVQLRPDGDGLAADCRLLGRRALPGQPEQETEHFRARVRLTSEAPAADRPVRAPVDRPAVAVGAGDIYKVYFHGPAYQVMDEAWKDGDRMAGRMAGALPPDHRPEEVPTVMEPRLIELCFQTAGLGELGTTGRMALPLHVDRVQTLRHPNGEPLYAVARHLQEQGGVDAWVVDGQGNVYVTLSGYRTIELPGGVAPEALEPLREAMA